MAAPDHRDPARATTTASLVSRLRAAGCVFAEEEAAVLLEAADDAERLAEWCRRRVAGEPLEHVVGHVAFAGRHYLLGPGTFVPRRRSEFLVDRAVAAGLALRTTAHPVVLVEMCCGIGAVGVSAARALRAQGIPVRTHLADIDEVALGWARRNAADAGPPVPAVHRGDLWSALPTRLHGQVDVVVANAPYVPTGEIPLLPPEARLHEPRAALDGGPEGIDLHRRLATGAAGWLRPGGVLIIETSVRQAPLTASLMTAAGLTTCVDRDEDRGATAVTGRRAADGGGAPG